MTVKQPPIIVEEITDPIAMQKARVQDEQFARH